ncbi:LysR family transcriptional regulator [Pandoraea horticolens]|uniref:LysR family transcriptional regulator n=1 Tax=Pandoraea horticolens TaxID=2508298 RepID=A0A5E4U6V6_9BURK|nr:hypothetical protein [Pandoraea horticolens]VVD95817.1 LysR family transcriptional regulator [Pandoraea horticolens]
MLLRTSPTVWICASQYEHVPHAPIPLVLADEPSIFGRLAIEALDAVRMRWRKAYVVSNLLGPELRVLGDSDGLPRLPDVNYYL